MSTYPQMINGETPFMRLLHKTEAVYETPTSKLPLDDKLANLSDHTKLGKPSPDANKTVTVSRFEQCDDGCVYEDGKFMKMIKYESSTLSDEQKATIDSAISNCSVSTWDHMLYVMMLQQEHEVTFVCTVKSTALEFKKAVETAYNHINSDNVDDINSIDMDVDFEANGESFRYIYKINSKSTITLYYTDKSEI